MTESADRTSNMKVAGPGQEESRPSNGGGGGFLERARGSSNAKVPSRKSSDAQPTNPFPLKPSESLSSPRMGVSFLTNAARIERGGGLTREQLSALEHVEQKAAIKAGRLRPGGEAGKAWGAERFYVLTEDGLFGYKSEQVEDLKRPLEVHWKAHFEQVISTSPDSSPKDRTTFALIVDTQKTAPATTVHVTGTAEDNLQKESATWVHFCAATIDIAQDWKLALRSLLTLNKPRRLFDGHLWKKSNMLGRNAWKKKYFALYSDRRLVSYKRETDKAPRFDLALSDRSRVIGEGGSMDPKAKPPPVDKAAIFSVSTYAKNERGLLAPPSLIHLAAMDVAEAVLWVRSTRRIRRRKKRRSRTVCFTVQTPPPPAPRKSLSTRKRDWSKKCW